MTKRQKNSFISKVAKAVQKLAPTYGIKVVSPIVAQCIVESGWGESRLAKDYNNFFGIKAGSNWTGKSVNLKTNEEYEPGTITTITDAFRVYDSLEEGVKGYFDLIQLPRYANLKGVTDPSEYCRLIKQDGYATDSKYVDTLLSVIQENNLTQYDTIANLLTQEEIDRDAHLFNPDGTAAKAADAFLDVVRSWLGYSEANGKWREILAVYNSQSSLPRGYRISEQDPWCATFVSACAIKAGMTDIIPTEVSCEEQIKLFQKLGCWEEDGTIIPEPGDIIYYNWEQSYQPNNGFADHVGVVVSADSGLLKIIEGNMNGAVAYRTLPRSWGYIRGFARPKWGKKASSQTIQAVTTTTSRTLSKEPKWVGKVTASSLCVRSWAGVEFSQIRSWPLLSKGNLVDVCDEVKDRNGVTWFYIRIDGRIFGFVHSAYLERV